MAEYLAPGVYIEETSFRSKSIEGVSTSTTAFVGPTRRGPTSGSPELLTSGADFERIYGSPERLTWGTTEVPNYVALAVQAFFDNGGARLFVSRVFAANGTDDGKGTVTIGAGAAAEQVRIDARFSGAAGNCVVTFREVGQDIAGSAITRAPIGSVALNGATLVHRSATGWTDAGGASSTPASTITLLTLNVSATDLDGNVYTQEGLSFDAGHARFVGDVLGATPHGRTDELLRPIALAIGSGVSFSELRDLLIGTSTTTRELSQTLAGGDDGLAPTSYASALKELEALDDISIVAAPGHSALTAVAGDPAAAVRTELITHVEKRGLYRVAVLDSKPGDSTSEVRTTRGGLDSDRVALYYPWVTIANPLARPGVSQEPAEINVPPSGSVCGIYARTDVERGVWKSPANEVVRGALRFERSLSTGENELLNPLGVNCLRYFAGRGYRVWGARTAGSDPEWKYLSVRRYFNYLEASIERGTQWAVFEPNGPALWSNVRETIASFLYSEWRSGALLGEVAKEAFFVRCDRTTMTQNDLDNGRMVCLIGVAVVKPAEFVIFRIGQKTASARD